MNIKHAKKKLAAAVMAASLMLAAAGCGKEPSVTMEEAQVSLSEYKGVSVSVSVPDLSTSEVDVDSYIQAMVDYYNTYVASDETDVESGDRVCIGLELITSDGVMMPESNENVFVEAGPGDGSTYKEITEGIVGKTAGERVDIPVKVASGDATAHVTVKYILADGISVEGMTDADAKALLTAFMDEGGTVEDLRSYVTQMLTEQDEYNMRAEALNLIRAKLLETCKVDPFPDLELAARVDMQMAQMENTAASYYNMTLAQWCESMGMTEKSYRKSVEETLRENLEWEVILMAIGDKEGISYEEEDFQAYIDETVAMYSYESKEALYADYGETYLRNVFRSDYIIDWLIDNADITYAAGE